MEIAKNELSLESVQWGEFIVGEIFDFVMRGKRLIERDRIKGNIPYYSASKENNGLTDMIANPLFTTKNKLIISTFCDCYFVEGEFTASDEITIFGNDKLNKYNGLFIANIVRSNASKYAFGRKAFSERLIKQIIKLPLDSNNQPNYEFMESFMKNLEQKHLQKILAYYTHKLDSSGGGGVIPFDYNDYCAFIESSRQDSTFSYTCNLDKLQWREFVVGEIFEVKATKNGIDKNKLSGKKGKIPYITRTENQNGVDDFIAEQENHLKNERNVIIIGLDTQTAFYHNSEFYTGQNIQILKNANLNQYNALFMIQALRNLMTKFNWGGNGATLTRLKRGKILLPIDSKGNPNYAFMESFMKNLEQKHLRKIIKYYENKLLDSKTKA